MHYTYLAAGGFRRTILLYYVNNAVYDGSDDGHMSIFTAIEAENIIGLW